MWENFIHQVVPGLQLQKTQEVENKHWDNLTRSMSSAIARVSQKTITPVPAITTIQARQFLQAKMDDMLHCGRYLQ